MKYCYLCHDPLSVITDGSISYTASANAADKLYACARCVSTLGKDIAFDLLEEHYEHRASLCDTLTGLDINALDLTRPD